MKLFNEIESEITGKIVKVLVDDSTPVEYDQPLFLVDHLKPNTCLKILIANRGEIALELFEHVKKWDKNSSCIFYSRC